MMKPYVMGIDGGGTKSILTLSDLEGRELYTTRGGPTNIYATSQGRVDQVLNDLLHQSMEQTGLKIKDCRACCLGSSGVDRPHEKVWFTKVLQALGIQGNIRITNDAETVLTAGSGKEEGVVIISGTGSFGFGKDLQGNRARAGGWGHIIGDEGGGYYIGVKGITAAVRGHDGRDEKTLLYPMLMEAIGLEKPEEFYKFVYETAGKKDIAALSQVVQEACNQGDRKAKEILEDAAWELFLKACAVIRSLSFESRNVPLVVNGSVITKMEVVFQKFSTSIQESYPLVDIYRLDKDAAWGAVQIALNSLKKK